MVHRRDVRLKLQQRRIRRILLSTAYYDRERSETVCRVSRLDVLRMLGESGQLSLVPDVVRGEVLIDARGTGSFQRSEC
jgi:hypothetical protein